MSPPNVLDISQSARLGRLHTPLGMDELGLLRFDGTDGINELFEYRVEVFSQDPNIDFDQIIGQNVTIELDCVSGSKKYYDGIAVESQWLGIGDSGNRYRLILRPWFWLASRRRNQKIFHNKSVDEIVEEVLSGYGEDLSKLLTGDYPKLEYTVQYRESDLNFCCRMMEKYGINYHFVHELGSHAMVMTDHHDAFEGIEGGSRNYYGVGSGAHSNEEEAFATWSPRRVLTTGKIAMVDFNFKLPSQSMDTDHTGDAKYANNDLESFDYPGHYLDQGHGRSLAKLRMEQERSADRRHSATGNLVALCSGMRVDVNGHMAEGLGDKEYLCVRAHHHYQSSAYGSGSATSQKEMFNGHYEFVGTDVPFAPERKTHDVRVQGPQTAWVVGAGGEEIDCDEHGRILVKFHWDREAAWSMRCRVAQKWAGNGWGAMFIPRIGMEVVVDFLEGDPNHPIVVGCVYNGENKPPFELPANKTISGVKSDSSLGGNGYNEYVFEDKAGQELIRQHAQKDMHTKVLNDETREVDHDRTTTIGNDETRHVKGKEDHTIDEDSTYHIKGAEKRTIDKDLETTIGGNEKHETTGKRETKIKGEESLKVSKTTLIDGTQAITVKSMQSIELKVAGNSIKIDNTGIAINGLMIDVKATTMLSTSGLMSEHKGTAGMTIQGAVVKIN